MNYETPIFAPSDDPLQVTLLLLSDSSMMSLASTLDPMRAANRVARRPLFAWRIVTPDGAPAALTCGVPVPAEGRFRSEEHTSELQSLMRISYAVFCLKKKKNYDKHTRMIIKTTYLLPHTREQYDQ